MSDSREELSAASVSGSTNLSDRSALERLEQIDNDIANVLQFAQDTVIELENVPDADFSKLQHLSKQYFETCEKVKSEMKQSANYIQPYSPYGHGNYGLRKSVELIEARESLKNEGSSTES